MPVERKAMKERIQELAHGLSIKEILDSPYHGYRHQILDLVQSLSDLIELTAAFVEFGIISQTAELN